MCGGSDAFGEGVGRLIIKYRTYMTYRTYRRLGFLYRPWSHLAWRRFRFRLAHAFLNLIASGFAGFRYLWLKRIAIGFDHLERFRIANPRIRFHYTRTQTRRIVLLLQI